MEHIVNSPTGPSTALPRVPPQGLPPRQESDPSRAPVVASAPVPSPPPAADTVTYHPGWEAFPELSDRERLVLCAVADVCRHTLGMPFESQGTMGLALGTSGDALRELRLFQGDYRELQRHLLNRALPLTARERTFAAIAADVLHGVLDAPFGVHLRAALSVGATRMDIKAVLGFCVQFDVEAARRGIRVANWLAIRATAGAAGPFCVA